MQKGLSGFVAYTGATFDFPQQTTPTKSYVIASTFRSGSNYLCITLWETGVLGAPWEYFNYDNEKRFMHARLAAKSSSDYVRKLTACRTSPNGVFAVKAHFRHFEIALAEYPPIIEVMRDCKFIYINRRDKIAQATSMAKALQTNAWFAFDKGERYPLFYSHEYIDECLEEVKKQALGWVRWFGERKLTPLTIHYEDLATNPAATVAQIMSYIGVGPDPAARIKLPRPEKQSDSVSQEWYARYSP